MVLIIGNRVSTVKNLQQTIHSKSKDFPPVCLICESTDSRILHKFVDWRIIRCKACKLLYIHPLPSTAQLIDDAEKAHSGRGKEEIQNYFRAHNILNNKDAVIKEFTEILELLEREVQGRRLLDIGSGDGTFGALAIQRGWDVTALDFSKNAALHARKAYNLETVTNEFPCEELQNQNKFDAITMLDFLEHVRNPKDSVAEANRLLKEGGLLFVNSPNHRSLLCWSIDIVGRLPVKTIRELLQKYYCIAHISIFEQKSLANLMKQSGLCVESVGQNSPIIERFFLPKYLRIILRIQIFFARVLHLESRVWVLARAPK